MKRVQKAVLSVLWVLIAGLTVVPAGAAEEGSVEERLGRLEERLGLRAGESAPSGEEVPLAAPIGPYRKSEGYHFGDRTSLGAYGEAIYNNVRGDANKDQLDLRRVVIYMAHEFSEEWRFFTEVEFEHAKELDVEQAFIDWQPSEYLGFQGGLLLVPVGIINPIHEPTTFYIAERPRVDTLLVPTTWREVGLMAYGSVGDFTYQIGALASGKPLDEVAGATPATTLGAIPTGGIRAFRQSGQETEANDIAVTGRLTYTPLVGLTFGTSGYTGEVDQDSGAAATDARISIWEADGRWQWEQLEIRGQYAVVWISDAAAINSAFSLTGTTTVPERMHGGYVEAAYNILPFVFPDTKQRLYVAFRGEWLDLQAAIPAGAAKTGAAEQQEYNFGLAWKPVEGVIVKADYQVRQNDAGGVPNRFNTAVGFSF